MNKLPKRAARAFSDGTPYHHLTIADKRVLG